MVGTGELSKISSDMVSRTYSGRAYFIPPNCVLCQLLSVYWRGGDENVWGLDRGGGCTTVSALNAAELHPLKWLTLHYVNSGSIKTKSQ